MVITEDLATNGDVSCPHGHYKPDSVLIKHKQDLFRLELWVHMCVIVSDWVELSECDCICDCVYDCVFVTVSRYDCECVHDCVRLWVTLRMG